jgi:ribonuclease BN (tRNA processing enzyme)
VKLTVLGASPSFPNPGGAGSSYLIEHERVRLLVDCGHGSVSRLFAHLDPRSLSALVLSHLHPDHFFDLIPLTYAFRFRYSGGQPIPLWLPPGGTRFLAGFLASLNIDAGFLNQAFVVAEYVPDSPLEVGGICITFAPTNHFVQGYAMLFEPTEAGSPRIGYSSDTGPSGEVARLLSDAELALVEATELQHPPGHALRGHLTAAEAGSLAREAGVGRLLLTHYVDADADAGLLAAAAEFCGSVELAREGKVYEL